MPEPLLSGLYPAPNTDNVCSPSRYFQPRSPCHHLRDRYALHHVNDSDCKVLRATGSLPISIIGCNHKAKQQKIYLKETYKYGGLGKYLGVPVSGGETGVQLTPGHA